MNAKRSTLVATLLLVVLVLGSTALAKTIPVSPGSADAVIQAFAAAQPGDVVELAKGTYTGTITVTGVSGKPDQPIVIRSAASASADFAVVDAGGDPASGKTDNPGIVLSNVSWVSVENLKFKNCWSDVVSVEGSSYVSIIGCQMEGGTLGINTDASTHHVLAEGCTWSQDPKVWTTYDWTEMHHGSLAHFNGGFYGGRSAGGAVIRHNTIRYAFNGLRWWLKGTGQYNVEIYDNMFEFCLDNFVEPEVFTANLHIYHNRFDSCPNGVFSIDKVAGGPIYIYGNVGRWERAGCSKEKPWTLYKFSDYGNPGWLDQPLYLLHNSWDYHEAFGSASSKGEDHLRHFNNAYLFQNKGLMSSTWLGKDSQFDYDGSSAPWSSSVTGSGFETNGVVGDPKFNDPKGGDYRLGTGSPFFDKGKVIDGFSLWHLGSAPDLGAYEGQGRVYGMPLEHTPVSTYKERPRIVRVFARGQHLVLFFSTDLTPSSLTAGVVKVKIDDASYGVQAVTFNDDRAPVLTLDKVIPSQAKLAALSFSPMPQGKNGLPCTLWGADLRLVQIPPAATLLGLFKKLLDGAAPPGDAGPLPVPDGGVGDAAAIDALPPGDAPASGDAVGSKERPRGEDGCSCHVSARSGEAPAGIGITLLFLVLLLARRGDPAGYR